MIVRPPYESLASRRGQDERSARRSAANTLHVAMCCLSAHISAATTIHFATCCHVLRRVATSCDESRLWGIAATLRRPRLPWPLLEAPLLEAVKRQDPPVIPVCPESCQKSCQKGDYAVPRSCQKGDYAVSESCQKGDYAVSESLSPYLSLSLFIYIYIYIKRERDTCIYIYIYIYKSCQKSCQKGDHLQEAVRRATSWTETGEGS